jgi:hypothetical protein
MTPCRSSKLLAKCARKRRPTAYFKSLKMMMRMRIAPAIHNVALPV